MLGHVIHLVNLIYWIPSINKCREINRLGAAMLKEGVEMLVDDQSPESQTCHGMHPEQFGEQGKEGILPFHFILVRPDLECCIQLWSFQHWNGID